MEQTLAEFSKQFLYEPGIANSDTFGTYTKYVLLGMGGSHLAADIIKRVHPEIDLVVWSHYGLPPLADIQDRLVIVSSYSGNTEEVLDGLHVAKERGIPVVIITTGGALKDHAIEKRLPHVLLPATGIQPRNALGYALRGLFKIFDLEDDLVATVDLEKRLVDDTLKIQGEELGRVFVDRIPVFYASQVNRTVAYNWKIKINETAKIPAFYNIIPELNHNELSGMDRVDSTKTLSEKFAFFFITDTRDHERVQLRMRATKELYNDRGLTTHEIPLDGDAWYERILRSLIRADWFALTLAKHYGVDPDTVPIIEEFKKMISV